MPVIVVIIVIYWFSEDNLGRKDNVDGEKLHKRDLI